MAGNSNQQQQSLLADTHQAAHELELAPQSYLTGAASWPAASAAAARASLSLSGMAAPSNAAAAAALGHMQHQLPESLAQEQWQQQVSLPHHSRGGGAAEASLRHASADSVFAGGIASSGFANFHSVMSNSAGALPSHYGSGNSAPSDGAGFNLGSSSIEGTLNAGATGLLSLYGNLSGAQQSGGGYGGAPIGHSASWGPGGVRPQLSSRVASAPAGVAHSFSDPGVPNLDTLLAEWDHAHQVAAMPHHGLATGGNHVGQGHSNASLAAAMEHHARTDASSRFPSVCLAAHGRLPSLGLSSTTSWPPQDGGDWSVAGSLLNGASLSTQSAPHSSLTPMLSNFQASYFAHNPGLGRTVSMPDEPGRYNSLGSGGSLLHPASPGSGALHLGLIGGGGGLDLGPSHVKPEGGVRRRSDSVVRPAARRGGAAKAAAAAAGHPELALSLSPSWAALQQPADGLSLKLPASSGRGDGGGGRGSSAADSDDEWRPGADEPRPRRRSGTGATTSAATAPGSRRSSWPTPSGGLESTAAAAAAAAASARAAAVDPSERPKVGRPRKYDLPSDSGSPPSGKAKTSKKGKATYATRAESLARRRERNRASALEAYYRGKARRAALESELQQLREEDAALRALAAAAEACPTTAMRVRPLLEAGCSAVEVARRMREGQ